MRKPFNPRTQIDVLIAKAGLDGLLGTKLMIGVNAVADAGVLVEGEELEVPLFVEGSRVGTLFVGAVEDSEDEGLTLGLRGWRLSDDTASLL